MNEKTTTLEDQQGAECIKSYLEDIVARINRDHPLLHVCINSQVHSALFFQKAGGNYEDGRYNVMVMEDCILITASKQILNPQELDAIEHFKSIDSSSAYFSKMGTVAGRYAVKAVDQFVGALYPEVKLEAQPLKKKNKPTFKP